MNPSNSEEAAQQPGQQRHARRALLWTLLALVLANLGAFVLELCLFSPEASGLRNPGIRRGWARYTVHQEPLADSDFSIILIGNSQATGEAVVAENTYPALLHAELEKRLGVDIDLRNWGATGARLEEMTLLVAAAKQLEPDLIIVVSTASRFVPWVGEVRLRDHLNDIHHLLAYQQITKELPNTFLSVATQPIDRIDAVVARCLPLWRLREFPVSAVLSRLGLSLSPYGEDLAATTWHQRRQPARSDAEESSPSRPAPMNQLMLHDRAQPVDRQRATEFAQQLATSSTMSLMLTMPQRSDRREGEAGKSEDLRSMAEAAGIGYLDHSASVGDIHFLDAHHFQTTGHAAYASVLAEVLAPIVSQQRGDSGSIDTAGDGDGR